MTKYYVVTPVYTTYYSPWGLEPPDTGADVVEVEAQTKREAKVLGVRELRRTHSKWMQDRYTDGLSPFTGIKVYRWDEDV